MKTRPSRRLLRRIERSYATRYPARGTDGAYRSGDGWAWGVMKPMANADATAQAYVNMPIPGFWTQAVASADGKSWAPKCAPKFDPDDPKHGRGLCRACDRVQTAQRQPGGWHAQ